MYNTSSFTSDLMNSYAWDTTLVFLQEFDNRSSKPKPYSWQTSLNADYANKGTNNLTDIAQQDRICNIWDMASNEFEYTTEKCLSKYNPVINRGGSYQKVNNLYDNVGNRTTGDDANNWISFRLVLYLKN